MAWPKTRKRIDCSTCARRLQNSSFHLNSRNRSDSSASAEATTIPPSSNRVSTSRAVPLCRSPRRARICSPWCRLRTALVFGKASHTSALNRSCQLSVRVCTSPVSKTWTSYWTGAAAGGTNRIGAPPSDGFARAQRNQRRRAERDFAGHGPGFLAQSDRAAVAWQAVEIRPVKAGKGLDLVERPRLLEGLRIELDRRVRRIDARVAAQRLLVGAGMRRAVGAEEEFRIAAGRRAHERLAMLFALQHRQAVIVRPDAAREHRTAVVEQVMRGDRGGDPGTASQDEFHRFAGGDMLDHDPQPREAARDAGEHRFEKHALAIEDVHAGSRDFPVYEKRQIVFLHRGERAYPALAAM